MSINLKACMEHRIFSDENRALKFAIDHDLLSNGCYCSDDCEGILEFKNDPRFPFKTALYCPVCKVRKSIFAGSIFTRSKLQVHKVLELIYYWAKGAGIKETAFEVDVNKNTVTNFFQAFRDACGEWVGKNASKKIGGVGYTVKVDETVMVKR